MKTSKPYNRNRFRGIKEGYRSGLEEALGAFFKSLGLNVEYEPKDGKINYIQPETSRKYTPDFILPNGIVIESKGLFNSDDRKKHLLIKEQYPNLDLRFIFSGDPHKKYLTKAKASSYADWCNKHGFKYAWVTKRKGGSDFSNIPKDWFK